MYFYVRMIGIVMYVHVGSNSAIQMHEFARKATHKQNAAETSFQKHGDARFRSLSKSHVCLCSAPGMRAMASRVSKVITTCW